MSSLPRVIVTCGPSYEPIDQVRRLTNFSTGSLGLMLSTALAQEGYPVTCFKGEGATAPLIASGFDVVEFSTNDHLYSLLAGIDQKASVAALFHTAALCDFKVQSIQAQQTTKVGEGKISSRAGELQLILTPALKLISHLRSLFPSSQIYGWKYEVEGKPQDAIAKGISQITANDTTACIVNGPAYGEGFGFLNRAGEITHIQTRPELCAYLVKSMRL